MKVKEWIVENLGKLEKTEDFEEGKVYKIELYITSDLEVVEGVIK